MAILVIGEPFRKNKRLFVLCKCDCGKQYETRIERSVKNGSCGCSTTKHGSCREAAYVSWKSMMDRCENTSSKDYPRYGAVGIRVCDKWKDVKKFIEDMGPRPIGTTIDRIDNSKGYEPGNCRWATCSLQNRNKSNNRILTIYGKSMCVTEWCEISGTKRNTAFERIKRGYSHKEAIFGKLKP